MAFGSEDFPHNRRAFPRWEARFSLQYGKPKPRKKDVVEPAEGQALQMSVEGLAFQGSTVYPVGTELALRFQVDENRELAPGAVVRAQEGNVMRVEFVRLSREERLTIVERLLPKA